MIIRRHTGENGKGYKESQTFRFGKKVGKKNDAAEPDAPEVRAEKENLVAEFLAEHPEKRLLRMA